VGTIMIEMYFSVIGNLETRINTLIEQKQDQSNELNQILDHL
jgi:hypothetical protein